MVDDRLKRAVGVSLWRALYDMTQNMDFILCRIFVKEVYYHFCGGSVQAGKEGWKYRERGFFFSYLEDIREKSVGHGQLREGLDKRTEK